ncbi:golgin candidate 5-like [Aristolochia californica]|uniref:golgin candidate 5-like n=1 Tax=Aristolochia californica TaxID=171875 RepID=UPI0035D981E5
MAWLGKVSLGGFSDLAGAVNKLSESVKNIEKNFDSALGLEEKSDSSESTGLWPSSSDRKALFDPVMAFMGHKSGESSVEPSENAEPSQHISDGVASSEITLSAQEQPSTEDKLLTPTSQEADLHSDTVQTASNELRELGEAESDSHSLTAGTVPSIAKDLEKRDSTFSVQEKDGSDLGFIEEPQLRESVPEDLNKSDQAESSVVVPSDAQSIGKLDGNQDQQKIDVQQLAEEGFPEDVAAVDNREDNIEPQSSDANAALIVEENAAKPLSDSLSDVPSSEQTQFMASKPIVIENELQKEPIKGNDEVIHSETDKSEQCLRSGIGVSDTVDTDAELERLRLEMKMMEAALQGAARQAQSKADEIALLMNENEHLKSMVEELKRKSGECESDALREEYHQRVASLERKVYALTKERDTLRREQSKKSDATALLKEKDEIISQVMAEGEELSRKQASQESQIRKLRAQIRELEEEKQRLNSKIQVEETKVDSIKRDKSATEKLLQETIEKSQAELVAQKEFYTNALNAAKEAEALAEARANNEARIELEGRLREAAEREATLVQALEELRQTLTRTEQQAVFREDMLQRDIDDLQKRYQASEQRCEALIAQVPESTRPLLRQIEAVQETTARRAEAWAGVERALNSRLQEAEAKAAAAEERERSMNGRLSQTLSRNAVLEAQVSCLRAEQAQLSRSLEKERQRASENRQEYLAALEAAATQEVRAKQLVDELKEFRSKHKHELQQEVTHRELLEQELEQERAARLELERAVRRETSAPTTKQIPYAENGIASIRKLSSAGSLTSMEESYFLQASLDSSDGGFSERRLSGETTMTPYFLKSMTPSAFEATLRQKDGELASYMSRLMSLESIRDSLAEELVKMTAECEKLRTEAAVLPSIQAELEALRRRHTAALELMGERDEELEELRADIVDMKEMYREQVDLLVNKLQTMSSSLGAA